MTSNDNLFGALGRHGNIGFGHRDLASLVQSMLGSTTTETLRVRKKARELGLDRGPNRTALAGGPRDGGAMSDTNHRRLKLELRVQRSQKV